MNRNKNHYIIHHHISPTRNKFIYPSTVKILYSGSIYDDIADVKDFAPEKVVEILEKVVVDGREVG